MRAATVGESLTVLSLNADSFQGCASLEDEWKVVKKAFLKIALVSHPDKGGDAVAFQRARQAFDGLRTLYEAGLIARFVGDFEGVQFPSQETEPEREGPPPPWEFYEAAAEDVMPIYRVELAKSSRSACQKCKKTIDEGTIRAGWMDPITGSYGRWCHIGCWKVPSKIWLGLPVGLANDVASVVAALSQMGGVLLSGFAQLDNDEKRREVAMHVMQKDNWAALKKAKKGKTDKNDAVSERSIVPAPVAPAPGTDVGPANRRVFVTPLPGKDAAVAGALSGWTCVLTGTFPEIGGGSGLDLGKDRVTQMIAGFGGRVTQAISGRTNLLVVGKSPGFSKFDKATRLGVKKVSLADLAETLRKGEPIANVPAFVSEMRTRDFSTGFYNNGLAGKMLAAGETYAPLGERAQTAPARASTSIIRVDSSRKKRKPAKKPKKRSRTVSDANIVAPTRRSSSRSKKKQAKYVFTDDEEEEEDHGRGGGGNDLVDPPQVPTRSPSHSGDDHVDPPQVPTRSPSRRSQQWSDRMKSDHLFTYFPFEG